MCVCFWHTPESTFGTFGGQNLEFLAILCIYYANFMVHIICMITMFQMLLQNVLENCYILEDFGEIYLLYMYIK